jgi:hypothetical protein
MLSRGPHDRAISKTRRTHPSVQTASATIDFLFFFFGRIDEMCAPAPENFFFFLFFSDSQSVGETKRHKIFFMPIVHASDRR